MRKDQHVNSLEKSLEWFKAEVLKQARAVEHYKTEAEKWKARYQTIDEEK